jgi:hypothetical protein
MDIKYFKILIKILVAVFLLWIPAKSLQAQSWQTFTISPSITFQLPNTPAEYDTLNMKFYSLEIDSTLNFQVHRLDSANFAFDSLFITVLNDSSENVLDMYAKGLLYLTNGSLVSIEDITTNNIAGKEVGILYNDPGYGEVYTFTRYYFYNNIFVSFSLTCHQDVINYATDLKDDFFDSITLL